MHADIYYDTDPDFEPLWLLDPAFEALAITGHDAPGAPTLRGLRQAADRVLDGAVRALGWTRTQAHQELWEAALSLADSAYVQVREEGACRTLAELRERVLAHVARSTEQERRDTIDWLRSVPQPGEENLRPFVRGRHIRFLAGLAIWLPLIGQPITTLADTTDTDSESDPTVLTVLIERLRRAGLDPQVFVLGALQCIQAHRADAAPVIIHNAVDQTLEIPLDHHQALTVLRYEPGSDPTLGDDCPGETTHHIWDGHVPPGSPEALRDLAGAVNAIAADAGRALQRH